MKRLLIWLDMIILRDRLWLVWVGENDSSAKGVPLKQQRKGKKYKEKALKCLHLRLWVINSEGLPQLLNDNLAHTEHLHCPCLLPRQAKQLHYDTTKALRKWHSCTMKHEQWIYNLHSFTGTRNMILQVQLRKPKSSMSVEIISLKSKLKVLFSSLKHTKQFWVNKDSLEKTRAWKSTLRRGIRRRSLSSQ